MDGKGCLHGLFYVKLTCKQTETFLKGLKSWTSSFLISQEDKILISHNFGMENEITVIVVSK